MENNNKEHSILKFLNCDKFLTRHRNLIIVLISFTKKSLILNLLETFHGVVSIETNTEQGI